MRCHSLLYLRATFTEKSLYRAQWEQRVEIKEITFDLQIVNGHTSSDQRKITNRNNDYSESNSSDKMCPITNRNTRDMYLLNNIQFSFLYSFHSVEDSCFQKPYFHCCLHCFPLDSH